MWIGGHSFEVLGDDFHEFILSKDIFKSEWHHFHIVSLLPITQRRVFGPFKTEIRKSCLALTDWDRCCFLDGERVGRTDRVRATFHI